MRRLESSKVQISWQASVNKGTGALAHAPISAFACRFLQESWVGFLPTCCKQWGSVCCTQHFYDPCSQQFCVWGLCGVLWWVWVLLWGFRCLQWRLWIDRLGQHRWAVWLRRVWQRSASLKWQPVWGGFHWGLWQRRRSVWQQSWLRTDQQWSVWSEQFRFPEQWLWTTLCVWLRAEQFQLRYYAFLCQTSLP